MSGGNLCEVLIDEIFERLPVKSLLRFKSLSKLWYSRIASPDFINKHTLRSVKTAPPKFLIHHRNDLTRIGEDIYTLHSKDRLPLELGLGYTGIKGVAYPDDLRTIIIGSCNGILCLRHIYNNNSITLWNVYLRRKLTPPDRPFLQNSMKKVAFGFGFDPVTNDYKICCIEYPNNHNSFIYSMKKDSWSKIAFPTPRFYTLNSSRPCFFNGILHWVVNGFSMESSTKRCDYIITFNLTSHAFDRIMLPKQCRTTRLTTTITIIDGFLAVISKIHDNTWIWVMKEYNNVESWYMHSELIINRSHNIVAVFQNGDLVISTTYGYQIFNPRSGSLSKFLGFGPYCFQAELVPYVESFELLDKGTPCGKTVLSWTEKTIYKRARLSE